MNTEYAVGNIRIRFASQARRRWFVALVYAALACVHLGRALSQPKERHRLVAYRKLRNSVHRALDRFLGARG